MAVYTFRHFKNDPDNGPYPENTETIKTVSFNDDAMDPWNAVLYEFCNFLSGVYGYNITEQVLVEKYDFDTGEMVPETLSNAIS